MNDQQKNNAVQMKWTDEQDDMLRDLYAQNLSTALIAERMGFGRKGKNKVIGRSHRIGLKPRPSCIIVNAPAMPAPAPKPIGDGPTLPPLASFVGVVETPPATEPDAAPAEVLLFFTEPAVEPLPALASPPTRRCAFPLWGDKDRPTHKYCGDPVDKRSYCAAHSALAYVGLRRSPFRHHYDY